MSWRETRDKRDAARRGSRFRSSERRLCYGQALAPVMPRRPRAPLAHAPGVPERSSAAPAPKTHP
jgi:hypothetical protein